MKIESAKARRKTSLGGKVDERGGRLAAAIEMLETRRLLSAALMADINPAPLSSGGGSVWAQDKLFFSPNTASDGNELWVIQGTTPQLVKDINPGTASGFHGSMVAVGGMVYFLGQDPATGWELWKSDGTAAGTFVVKDISPGTADSTIFGLTSVGGGVFFFTENGTTYNLWKSDGTAAGTVKLQGSWTSVNWTTGAGNTFYFTGSTSTYGNEVWKSDGTDAGTTVVKDLVPGASSYTPDILTAVGSKVYFRANNSLWVTDGSDAGTTMLKSFGSDWPTELSAVGNRLFFAGRDSVVGNELWVSDGTVAGTYLVKDIAPGNHNSNPDYIVGIGSVAYFQADDNGGNFAVWRSDGTAAGTYLVKDSRALGDAPDWPLNLTVVGNTLYFASIENQLWKSDGTAAGTVMVKDLGYSITGTSNDYPIGLTAAGNRLYFSATDGYYGKLGQELWTSDGTAAGTVCVRDFTPGSAGSYPSGFTVAGNRLYFNARDGIHGNEPWSTDGTPAGTAPVGDIWPGNDATSSSPKGVEFNGQFYFYAQYDGAGTYQPIGIFRTSGTPASTVRLISDLQNVGNFTVAGNTLYFTAGTYITSYLYKLDAGGTSITRLGAITAPQEMTAAGNLLFFYSYATDATYGQELWQTDGTDAGTHVVKDIQPGAASSYPGNLLTIGNTLYFSATDPTLGPALFRSDGTDAGTYPLKAIPASSGLQTISNLTNVGGIIYFQAGGSGARELWKSDGTSAGTVVVKTGISSLAGAMAAAGNKLFFTANGEPWVSDGTSAGTFQLKDINPGVFSSSPAEYTAVGGTIYFTANDPTNGNRIWQSDGTPAGTILSPSVSGISDTGIAFELFAFNNSLYVAGSDGLSGRELFRVIPDNGMFTLDPSFEANEADGLATVTVKRSGGSSGSATVNYSATAGSASAGADFTPVSGTIVFADGETSKTFAVPLTNDSVAEVDETINLTLSQPTAAFIGLPNATLTVHDDDQANISIADSSVVEGNSGTTNAVFTVTLSKAVPVPVTVDYFAISATQDGVNLFATSVGSDFKQTTGTLTIPAGQTSATITVPVIGETVVEADETFYVVLSNPAGPAKITRPNATGTIINDDVNGSLQFSSAAYAVAENGGLTVLTVTRVGSGSSLTVQYETLDGTATAPSNYAATSGTLSFGPTDTQKSIIIPLQSDSIAEGDETFTVRLFNPSSGGILGTPSTTTVTLTEMPVAAIGDAEVLEGNSGNTTLSFPVTLSRAAVSPVTMSWFTLGGSATSGSDFVSASGTLNIPAGGTSGVVDVQIIGDLTPEADETFTVQLYSPSNATIGRSSATGTILNDDTASMISFSSPTYSTSEAGGSAIITLTRTGNTAGNVSARMTTSDGTAKAGSDYTAVSTTVSFASGETSKTISIPITNDAIIEPAETINLALSNPTGGATLGTAAAVLTIADDDRASVSVADVAVNEGDSGQTDLAFTVSLSAPLYTDFSVQYATQAGTASAGDDFVSTSGTLTIPAGVTSGIIHVPTNGDTAVESDETLSLLLSNPTGPSVLTRSAAVGTIRNDDNAGVIQFSSATYSVSEAGGAAVITFTRTGGTSGAVSVDFSTANGTATAGSDYSAVATTVTFAHGESSKTVSIPVLNDSLPEGDETVSLSLKNVSGGAGLGLSTATLKIVDDGDVDTTPPTVQIAAVSPSPRTTPVSSVVITFSEPVAGFDLADLALTRNGGANLLPGGATLGSSDGGVTWTLGNLDSLTAAGGNYTVTLNAAGAGIFDVGGNSLATGASTSFTVTATDPTPAISGVSPNPVVGSALAQNLTIAGTGFTAGSIVRLKNLSTNTTISSANVVSRTSTQMVVSQQFGTTSANWSVEVLNGGVTSGAFNFQVVAPTQLAIGVSPNPVTAKTAALTAVNGGTNTSTVFAWSVTAKPSGATAPTFSRNSSNAAKSATITFFKAGSYTLKLTSTTGSTVKTATLTFTVIQTLTSIAVSPTSATIFEKTTKQITASAKDQFGAVMSPQPAFSWTIDAGGTGTISSSGLYTAGLTPGAVKVRATAGAISATAALTVIATAKINFQKSGTPAVSGYLVDSGSTYAARNGLTYGWSTSHTDAAVDRNKNSNQLLDTNIGIKSGGKWELAVPSGTYQVKLSIGDSSAATTNTVRIEGATAYSATKLAANVFSSKLVTVTVTDGKLTVDAGAAAGLLTRVDYIEITKI